MDQIAESLRQTSFLSEMPPVCRGPRSPAPRTRLPRLKRPFPTHSDVRTSSRPSCGSTAIPGKGPNDGRKLQNTVHKGVYRLRVPSVIQDDKLPKQLDRVDFRP